MPSHLSNPWNSAVSFLSMLYGEERLGSGSSFFWGSNEKTYLVTNWHNLSGRNPRTGHPLQSTGKRPDRATFMAYRHTSKPDVGGFVDIAWEPVTITLCDPDHTNPRWFEHPTLGPQVDIAAIEVTSAVAGYHVAHVNLIEGDAILDPRASQDVFVIGFPFGLIANAPAPLWKRGSIALDPTFDADGLPKMLVDTATREGMSGSVVIARHIVVGRSYQKKNGTASQPVLYATLDQVIGIYSGRHYPDLERAQLGIVWKRHAIEETIARGRPATA